MLAQVVAELGPERVLFGSDFPHTDHDDRALDAMLARRAEIGDPALRDNLWNNPRRLLGLSPEP